MTGNRSVFTFIVAGLLVWVLSMFPSNGMANDERGQGGVSMRVLWSVLDYRRLPNAEWSDEQAKSMLFKPLDMDDSSITFDGRKCRGLTFETEEVSLRQYLSRLHPEAPAMMRSEDERATLVRTDCDIPGFAEFIRVPGRRLIIQVGGVLFFLEPRVHR